MPLSTSVSTGKLSTSQLAVTGAGFLTGVHIISDGVNDVTVNLYDGTSTSGRQIFTQKLYGSDNVGGWIWNFPLRFSNGIYLSLSGTGGYCYIEYTTY
jgi:hypothetical protein